MTNKEKAIKLTQFMLQEHSGDLPSNTLIDLFTTELNAVERETKRALAQSIKELLLEQDLLFDWLCCVVPCKHLSTKLVLYYEKYPVRCCDLHAETYQVLKELTWPPHVITLHAIVTEFTVD